MCGSLSVSGEGNGTRSPASRGGVEGEFSSWGTVLFGGSGEEEDLSVVSALTLALALEWKSELELELALDPETLALLAVTATEGDPFAGRDPASARHFKADPAAVVEVAAICPCPLLLPRVPSPVPPCPLCPGIFNLSSSFIASESRLFTSLASPLPLLPLLLLLLLMLLLFFLGGCFPPSHVAGSTAFPCRGAKELLDRAVPTHLLVVMVLRAAVTAVWVVRVERTRCVGYRKVSLPVDIGSVLGRRFHSVARTEAGAWGFWSEGAQDGHVFRRGDVIDDDGGRGRVSLQEYVGEDGREERVR